MAQGGTLTAPGKAMLYDRNLLPIGQAMWNRELGTYKKFPLLQPAAGCNLDHVIFAMQDAKSVGHASDQTFERIV